MLLKVRKLTYQHEPTINWCKNILTKEHKIQLAAAISLFKTPFYDNTCLGMSLQFSLGTWLHTCLGTCSQTSLGTCWHSSLGTWLHSWRGTCLGTFLNKEFIFLSIFSLETNISKTALACLTFQENNKNIFLEINNP